MKVTAAGEPDENSLNVPHVAYAVKKSATLAALLTGVIAFQLNASMVAPAVPEIARRLQSTPGMVGISQTLFFLVGGIAGIVLTRYSDLEGRRKILLYSLAVMSIGTVLAMLAPNVALLCAGRLLQGASGSIFQITYLILRDILTPKQFGPALGLVTAISCGVGGADQFLGGMLSDHWGFRSIFFVILLVGTIGIVLSKLYVPESVAKVGGSMDWLGAAALSAALIFVNVGVASGGSQGWASLATLALLGVAAACFVAFWFVEKCSSHPLISTAHLKSRQIWPIVATTLATLTGLFAAINFTVVVFSQDTRAGFGMTATTSALLFLSPAAAIGVFAAPVTGWLAPRAGWRVIMWSGLTLSIFTMAVATLMLDQKWIVVSAFALLGIFYNGLALTTINGLGVILSPEDAPGSLPGLNGACFQIGAGLGIALVVPVVSSGTYASYQEAMWISTAVVVLALIASLFVRGAAGQREEKI
ncbi:MAG TPA: MFS transporter [Candidatus Acidoferrales bacterium]|nr:MFS transporter [Candidatus Acidoferrales bacterium]